jgi:membrane protease YdiL (CAAX protease family)
MVVAVMILGAVAEAAGWWLVTGRGRSVWAIMPVVLGVLGLASLVVGDIVLSATERVSVSAGVGVAAGAALFLATRAFVALVRGWSVFRSHAAALYARGGSLPLAVQLLLGAGVAVVGEELLWRGLFQTRLASAAGRTGGAVLTWVAFIGANLPSLNLAAVAAAIVGGAAWVALAWWSGGVLASLCCHAVWTGLMTAFPPVMPARAGTGEAAS